MQYGRPTLFALQSLWRSVRAQLSFDWRLSSNIYLGWRDDVFIAVFGIGLLLSIHFSLGLVESMTGADIFEHGGGELPTRLLVYAVMISVALVLAYLALLLLASITAIFFFLSAVLWSGLAIARLWRSMSVAGRLLEVSEWPPTKVKDAFAVHLTDLHITEGTPYELLVDPAGFAAARAPTCEQIDARLASVLAEIPGHNPLAIAVTGDITDSGDEEEWKRFGAIWIKQFGQNSSIPLWLVPGNHDISFNRGERPDPSGAAKREKEWRYLTAEAIARGKLTIDSIGRVADSGAIEIRPLKPRMQNLINQLIASGARPVESDGEFPRIDSLDLQGTSVNVITLNSCTYDSHFVLSNAIGKLGSNQLNLLREHLNKLNGPLLVLLHHHLALQHGRISLSRPLQSAQELMKLPVDARELASILGQYARSDHVLVLHGHQHENLRFYIDDPEGGRVHVFGLASSTLGCVELDPVTGRHALDGRLRIGLIGFDPDAGWSAEAKVLPFRPATPTGSTCAESREPAATTED